MQLLLKYKWIILIACFATSCAKPISKFAVSGDGSTAPAAVEFENKSKKADSYEWDFGDGEKSTEASPKHEYKSSGNYTVTLRAKKGKKESVSDQRVFIDAPQDCLILIETNYGNMTVKLYNETPKHRDNFIKLVEDGFYDGLLFHRVINGFMVQGGDPESRGAKPNKQLGSGGPGYTIDAEFNPTLMHVKGALSAARQGDNVNPKKKSSGSQFYIVHGRKVPEAQLQKTEDGLDITYTKEVREDYKANGGTPFLDMNYTVFGRVIEGLDVIDKIAAVKTKPGDRPVDDVWMKMKVIK